MIGPNDADCPYGGVLVETGIDENANGVLDDPEVDGAEKVCNGADGFEALVDLTPEPVGANCADGGQRIDSGRDANADGVLDADEISATSYVCNGTDGTDGADGADGADGLDALVSVTGEPAGTNCANGGQRIDSGRDADADGVLDAGEISATSYVCNGADGTDGANWWDDLGTTGTLEGYVYREDGTPARGAMVMIAGTLHYTLADGFGRYRFDRVSVGQRDLLYWLDGYTTRWIEAQPVTAGNTVQVRDVRLPKWRAPLPGTLSLTAASTFSGSGTGDQAGTAVAGVGDVNGDGYADFLVGAPYTDPGGSSNAGAAYLVYGRPGIDLVHVLEGGADATFTGATAGDYAGAAVAGAGDVNGDGYADLLVGAYGADPGGNADAGVAYLIYGGTSLSGGPLDAVAGAVFTGAATGDLAGWDVAGPGDVNGDGYADLLIGADYADPGGVSDAGAVYLVYGGPSLAGGALDAVADVTFAGAAAGDAAGAALAAAGDVNGDGYADLLVGAPGADPGGLVEAGTAYLVYGAAALSGGALDAVAGAMFTGSGAGDWAGFRVAGTGDVNGDGYADLLVGAAAADPGGLVGAGVAYLIYGGTPSGGALDAVADVAFSGAAAGDNAGKAVAGVGDVNGDGYADLLVGAPYADPGGRAGAGVAYLVYGASSLAGGALDEVAGTAFTGSAAGDIAGKAVAGAGDVNGDGYADLLVGAPQADPGGAVHLVLGRSRGVDGPAAELRGGRSVAVADAMFTGAAEDRAGTTVAGAGDVNGDGWDDFLIGAPNADPGGLSDAGAAYLVYGRPGLDARRALGAAPDVTFTGAASGDLAGAAVAGAGDVNGDGYADLLVGASQADPGGLADAGVAYLVYGASSLAGGSLDAVAAAAFTGTAAGDLAGAAVAGAGDVNGDGYADLLVGASQADPGGLADAGVAYLVYGASSPAGGSLDTVAGAAFTGAGASSYAGAAVAGAGDVNGDGYADLLVGAHGAAPGGNAAAGTAYLVYGGADLAGGSLDAVADAAFTGGSAGDSAGKAVAGAGDVNGDGYADLLVGVPDADPGGSSDAGIVYLVYGHASLAGTVDLATGADATFSGTAAGDRAGVAVAGAGDVDGDGYADLLVGAGEAEPGGSDDAGAAYLFLGRGGAPYRYH